MSLWNPGALELGKRSNVAWAGEIQYTLTDQATVLFRTGSIRSSSSLSWSLLLVCSFSRPT